MIVVPRRVLAAQHNRMAAWLRDRLPALLVTDEAAANPARLAARAEKAGLIIGLPGLLARGIETLASHETLPSVSAYQSSMSSTSFCFKEYHALGISVRFDRGFEELQDALPAKPPLAIMSGTAQGRPSRYGGHPPHRIRHADLPARAG
jgi:hypothetical protein